MRYGKIAFMVSVVCGILLNGCYKEEEVIEPAPIDQSKVDKALVESYSDLAIQNAIIAQHTIYPYHFVTNSAQLNGLGERDLAVLTAHFQQNPGQICLAQGQTESLLYQSRAQTIYEKLLQAGIPDGKIRITGGLPGGDGMPSSAVIEILENARTTSFDEDSSSSGFGIRQ
ncbi:MAG: hypothetical protein L0Y36_08345 [Planctomycetales bacterium]|nr:hypothetical protein [Planctomycetales bacterium]